MKKMLFFLSLGLILLVACQPQMKPADVVLAAARGLDSGDLDDTKMDASLAYYADDAIVKLVGLPAGQPDTFTGKEEIRAWWEGLSAQHFNMTVEVLSVDGDTVTTKTLTWMDWSRQAGIAPIEAIEVYVVNDGKIHSETWTITEASQASLQNAMAAAQAQPTTTPFPPVPIVLVTSTPALSPEDMAESLADLVGTWKGRWSDITSVYLEFKDSGRYRVSYPNGTEINSGYLSFESGRLTFESGQGTDMEPDCKQNFTATYEVYITRRGNQPYQLRFVLVGQDNCDNRKDFMDGKTMVWMEPK
jgi:hypothetical protein